MKNRYLLLIAILSYLFFTFTNVPAAKVYALVKSNINIAAQVSGIEGSLWKGSAQLIQIKNQPDITALHWSVNPLPLLIAQLSADLQATIEQQDVVASINFNILSNNIAITEARAEIDAGKFQQLINLPFGELAGKIKIELKQLTIEDQKITGIEGIARWNRAKFTLAETVSLGNIQISVVPDGTNLMAEISNKGGLIKLEGEASLTPEKNYQLDMKFIPAKNASTNIKQSLAMFAKRQTNGSYRFKQKGNLQQLGL